MLRYFEIIIISLRLTFWEVTGSKARGLQTEEIGCKNQTIFPSPLSSRRKQTAIPRFFFPSPHKIKRRFLCGNVFLNFPMLMKLCICFGICLSLVPPKTNFFLFSNLGLDSSSVNQYSYQLFYGWGMIHLVPSSLKNAYCGRWAWWNAVSLEVFLLSD